MDPITLTLRVGRLPAAEAPVGGELSAEQLDANFTALRVAAEQLDVAMRPFASATPPDPADNPRWLMPDGRVAEHDGEFWFVPQGTPGADGREVQLQVSATHIQWRYVGATSWTNLIALSSLGPTFGQLRKASYLL